MPPSDLEFVVSGTQAYYDGSAGEMCRTVWGDNIHLGVPCGDECAHPDVMKHTNEIMADAVELGPGSRVPDLGCGHDSTARYPDTISGCSVPGTKVGGRAGSSPLLRLGERSTA